MELVIRQQMTILAGLYGQHGPGEADAPAAHFVLPSNAQLAYARRICPSDSLAFTGEDLWTTEFFSVSRSGVPILMPLQPILVRAE